MTKVSVQPNGCWEWIGTRIHGGYGRIYYDGSDRYTHRAMYEYMNGLLPKGTLVLHRCDNPPCVNPKHLFAGTQTDNMTDCRSKGRMVHVAHFGESNGRAKLTERQVDQIRANKTTSHAALARRLGVSGVMVSLIRRGLAWRTPRGSVRKRL